jgi:hypothetical protein
MSRNLRNSRSRDVLCSLGGGWRLLTTTRGLVEDVFSSFNM